MNFRIVSVLRIMAAFTLLAVLAVACTGDDDEPDADDLRPITATPTAVVGLPEDINEVTVIVEDGSFDTDTINAIVGQPVLLTIANRDAETYTLVVESLITETEIPGAAETEAPFNAPNEGEYEGTLVDSDGEEVDTIFVVVEAPGRV
jgi:hypothetical protein